MATSSMRSRPTRQPAGASRLNSTSTTTVNAAWPKVNGSEPGA